MHGESRWQLVTACWCVTLEEGTTDLTLIGIEEQDGELVLDRRAVGNHLLVGGDNMDLTLAHLVAGQFAEQGVKLDPWQSGLALAFMSDGERNPAGQ